MKKIVWELLSTGLYVLGVLLITFLLITYVGQRVDVQGESMEYTLDDGDSLIADKISYRFRDPERFDIVVFPVAYDKRIYYIKRIIGLPGETVWIDQEGKIFVNGEQLVESYGLEVIAPEHIGLAAEPIVLGENEYFVLGDNRNNSMDSRMTEVGNVRREDLLGRAFMRIWPLSKFGLVEHQ